jgi:hypothetical protein
MPLRKPWTRSSRRSVALMSKRRRRSESVFREAIFVEYHQLETRPARSAVCYERPTIKVIWSKFLGIPQRSSRVNARICEATR